MQGNNSTGAIIALIVGVGIGVIALILVGSLGGSTYELVEDDINSIGNHAESVYSFTADNGSATFLGHRDIQEGTLAIDNTTHFIHLSNFTIDYTAGTALLVNDSYNDTTMRANYSYGQIAIQNSIKDGIISGFSSLETTGNYLPIIVLAVTIALVLGLVLGLSAISGTSRGSGGAL